MTRRQVVAGLEFPLLDAQWLCELRLVVSELLDEALGVLAQQKDVDGVAERAEGRHYSCRNAVHP